MFTISELESNLVGLTHNGSLNKLRNKYFVYERAAENLLRYIKPAESLVSYPLAQTVHDDQYTYDVPDDFGSLVSVHPQKRVVADLSERIRGEQFDRRKTIDDKKVAIVAVDGEKKIRIDWQTTPATILSNMDSYNGNGTWVAYGTANGVATDTQHTYSGDGSVRFSTGLTGDGIQNSTLDPIDLSDEDGYADAYVAIEIPDATALSHINGFTFLWGNDVTSNFWTAAEQTVQADGSAFRVGWNVLRFPWSNATETGSVDASIIDSARLTVRSDSFVQNLRVDNILFNVGAQFELVHYSKYLFMNSTYARIKRPTGDEDYVALDTDAFNIFLYECLIEAAHQIEGEDAGADAVFATKKLWGDPTAVDSRGRLGLYRLYSQEHPAETKKVIGSYGLKPQFRRFIK